MKSMSWSEFSGKSKPKSKRKTNKRAERICNNLRKRKDQGTVYAETRCRILDQVMVCRLAKVELDNGVIMHDAWIGPVNAGTKCVGPWKGRTVVSVELI